MGQAGKPSGPGKRRGKGTLAMWKAPAMPPNPGSSATIRFNETHLPDQRRRRRGHGQGALTVAAQLAAEGLGIPISDGRPTPWTPTTRPTSGRLWPAASPGAWATPSSALADEARTQIIQMVADGDEDPQDLDIIDVATWSPTPPRTDPAQGHRGLRHAEGRRHLRWAGR
ncbi:MAG: hypothetical protein R2844_00945 [Caldilineales bacterium]